MAMQKVLLALLLLALPAAAEVVAEPTPEQLHAANAAAAASWQPGEIAFPADSGVLNVRAFGATGDGTTDDTAAFQAALQNNRLIYVPNGTYRISDTLRWNKGEKRTVLQGQSRDKTILKLVDNAPGFDDPANPKAMIWTGRRPAQRFQNGLQDLTLDTGRGNPGATGAQFMSNNQGGIQNVLIRSGDPEGRGVIGLDLGYSDEQGPLLIRRLEVVGFDTGIFAKHAVNSITMEHVRLRSQRKVGLDNQGQCVSIRGLHSTNAVPAVQNIQPGVMTLIDSTLEGGSSDAAAIENEAALFARNVEVTDYAVAISGREGTVEGGTIEEHVSHDVHTLFETPLKSLDLPIKVEPEVPFDPPSTWTNVHDYADLVTQVRRYNNKKWRTFDDWAPAVQAAIDDGATTIYFPRGTVYGIFTDVHVHGPVRRIIGLRNEFRGSDGVGNPTDQTGSFVVGDGDGPVIIEDMDAKYAPIDFRHNGDRPLILSRLQRTETGRVVKEIGSGDLFINDMSVGIIRLHGGNTWSRQLNPEGDKFGPKIVNEGGTFWLLGLKTEGDQLLVDTRRGGRTEIVGGFIYANKNRDEDKVMFRVDATSSLSATIGEWVIRKQPFDLVVQTQDGRTKRLAHGQVPGRGEGSMLPLFVARPPMVEEPADPR
jgi:hypothetical protein